MKLSKSEETLAGSAAKAGMDEKTARKWRRIGRVPSEIREPRGYRTREDPFVSVWSQVEELLDRDASVEAKTIFDWLCRENPSRFEESQLRTLQRRVKVWRAQQGPPREVYFVQKHIPGRQAQSDFTYMGELGIVIAGQPFPHLLYHLTLTYSNWEWVMVCFSESYESLAEGMQNGFWEVGGVTQEHRTDSLSAAIKPLGSKEEFTERYKGLLRHYGLKASHSTPGRGHENGDIEQAHHRFKRGVHQELILRGSREFSSRGEYEAFLQRLAVRRNQLRQQRVKEEEQVLRRLPERRLEACTKEIQRVSRNSTICVRKNYYSVPSQLIRERVEIRIYAGYLEVWYAGQMVERMERLRGAAKAAINYRHIIHSLVRKPGAFAHYRFQTSLFPRLIFRVAYDELIERRGGSADREYVQLLKLAAEEGEDRVSDVLRAMVDVGDPISSDKVSARMNDGGEETGIAAIKVETIRLSEYDSLLEGEEVAA
ncbi:MAG: IS21 family transposase [Acidobacteriota bacterium]